MPKMPATQLCVIWGDCNFTIRFSRPDSFKISKNCSTLRFLRSAAPLPWNSVVFVCFACMFAHFGWFLHSSARMQARVWICRLVLFRWFRLLRAFWLLWIASVRLSWSPGLDEQELIVICQSIVPFSLVVFFTLSFNIPGTRVALSCASDKQQLQTRAVRSILHFRLNCVLI